MVIHRHWIQRLSVQISSSFLSSMINGAHDLLGNINIHRSPWFNFMEQDGRRGALRAIFEHFPLKTTCTLPLLPPIPTPKHKIDTDAIPALKKPRSRRRPLHRKVGDRAFSGKWEAIEAQYFDITDDMTMEFQGRSCNITDSEGNLVEKLGLEHRRVTREVFARYQCYVVRAWVKFEKKLL